MRERYACLMLLPDMPRVMLPLRRCCGAVIDFTLLKMACHYATLDAITDAFFMLF